MKKGPFWGGGGGSRTFFRARGLIQASRELAFKALRRVEDEDLLVILEVEFLEESGHGFLC